MLKVTTEYTGHDDGTGRYRMVATVFHEEDDEEIGIVEEPETILAFDVTAGPEVRGMLRDVLARGWDWIEENGEMLADLVGRLDPDPDGPEEVP